jgi:DNA invertase Pin-like site-specific DNA recombinase
MKRVAIYARVSTDDKGQDTDNQLIPLRQWASSAGYDVVGEYVDHVSGRKGTNGRKQFAMLFEDASKRKFDLVLFWSLDRFSREGLVPTLNYLQRLASYGVGFHSYQESHLSTDNELVRDILLSILAALAKHESKRISERVKAGIARHRAKGGKHGRQPVSTAIEAKVRRMLDQGNGMLKTAKALGVGTSVVQRIAAERKSNRRVSHVSL